MTNVGNIEGDLSMKNMQKIEIFTLKIENFFEKKKKIKKFIKH